MNKIIIALGILTLTALPVAGADKTGAAAARETPTPSLTQMLTYALQDEWAARAEYAAILRRWPDLKPFANIIRAEESHIGWLIPLFESRGLPVPVEPQATTIVPPDWDKALALGAEAEVLNIAMYERFLGLTLPDDVRKVFEELKRGSENHLKAFRGGGGGGSGRG